MNLRLLLALIVLSLTACGTRSVKDDSPASDLAALEATVARDLRVRLLPNGREYCAELARTERAKDECTGDLEDVVYASNRDKERGLLNLRRGLDRIRADRIVCRWYQVGCKRDREALRSGRNADPASRD